MEEGEGREKNSGISSFPECPERESMGKCLGDPYSSKYLSVGLGESE